MFRSMKLRVLSLVVVGLFAHTLAGNATAQMYRSLYTFTERSETGTNIDGARPKGGLARSGNVMYGTAIEGGAYGQGTVYKVNVDGTGFTTLHNFEAPAPGPTPPAGTNNEGRHPQAGVIVSGNTLYGTTLDGGPIGYGTVFKLNTDGMGFTVLHYFRGSNVDGNSPQGQLLLVGNTLYGTSAGNVFRVNTDGSDFAIVHMFGGNHPELGLDPSRSGLVLVGNTLYGMTSSGGSSYGQPPGYSGSGEVFAVDTDGNNFRILHNFTVIDEVTGANTDGNTPVGSLVLSGNTLYGTATNGGMFSRGTVFGINTDGNGFRVLHTFSQLVNFLNTDGAFPYAGLTLSGNKVYGTTTIGGAVASGTIYSVKTDGTDFGVNYNFHNGLGGGSDSPLIVDGTKLLGTSPVFPSGNVFSLSLAHPGFDFDGDGKSDLSVFRPSVGEWYYQQSSNNVTRGFGFGTSTDKVATADFTGDGKTDIAFWRPSTGDWYVLRSEDSTYFAFPFGASGDIPAPADYDGDGRADAAVFRPSVATWFILRSTGGVSSIPFGISSDVPVPADYDGDGKADVGIFRPGPGQWWNLRSSDNSVFAATFGSSTDKPVPGDYTGDGKADVAFWRPSNGNWFILRSENQSFYAFPFGANGDKPAPGDFDGDGKFDAEVFRPSDTNWYILKTTGGVQIQQFGAANDIPLPGAFVP